ncbi:zinc finger CW-type PWWP domain protein 1-like [Ostrinia furnacalis]|uniref:zinc finger CW-type PWWP domain protein 1-like n=1 Tax=Ostrinia furnacalis TaxID=93504 RepID=UPI00103A0B14|nr:zinc finger CW-type PWWP domain protein 1-like [Ostrinia furnacalis]
MDLLGDLPTEKSAKEPKEGARQPKNIITMSPPLENNRPTETQISEVSSSQCSKKSSYKDALSQPGPGMTQKQRLLWLQKRHKTGLWVQCDDCDRWRYLPHVLDSTELPKKWYCRMNPDRSAADCSVPEEPICLRGEEDLIHSEYSAGSIVLARLAGWPWWPAMVEDCADTEQFYWLDGFSDIPTYYNVVFFDSYDATRAWIAPKNLKPYNANKKATRIAARDTKYKKRLDAAYQQADDANMLPLAERLAKYSFLNRYKGTIGEPKEISQQELMRFKNKIKRILNIDLSDESASDSDDSSKSDRSENSKAKKRAMKNPNVILVGTPKRRKLNNGLVKAAHICIDATNETNQNSPVQVDETVNSADQSHSIFKQPNSLTVQVGSTTVPDTDTTTLDDDTSKTYLPENEMAHELTNPSQTGTEMHVRVTTPSSDDFEF